MAKGLKDWADKKVAVKGEKDAKPGPGSGKFDKLKGELEDKGLDEDAAAAIAATAGKKKYGAAQMAAWAKKGKAESAKEAK